MSQQRALELLRQGVGSPAANFHKDQWEAIDAIVNQRCRLICVQRTDWGHDFRPDYRCISRVLGNIADTPVLATTATATGRVVEDVVEQLRVDGQKIYLLRGQLTRESIHLQNIYIDKRSKRLAWLAHTIPKIEGTGIVYATTINDAFLVAAWLRSY
jgi:ATP-dependent DNA helicase RecQ